MTERILDRTESAYQRMELVAKALEVLSPNGKKYHVGDTYLDYGQNWMWTTIIVEDDMFGGCQVLCPRDWKSIVGAETLKELYEAIETIRNDRYFGDK